MFFSNDDNDGDYDRTEVKEERDLQPLRGSINKLALTLKERQFYAQDRQDIAQELGDILYRVTKLTDDPPLEWVPPEEQPRTKELALFLSKVNGVLTIENLQAGTDREDISNLHARVHEIQEYVDDRPDFPFRYEELYVSESQGKLVQSIGIPDAVDPEDVPPSESAEEFYAGPHARKAIEEIPRRDPSADLFVGLGTRAGRDVSIPRNELFVHRVIFGLTGTGKSTALTNDFKQLMETDLPVNAIMAGEDSGPDDDTLQRRGSANGTIGDSSLPGGRDAVEDPESLEGFGEKLKDSNVGGCMIDPKGDDAKRLMQILPEERLDDVIWIEPGGNGEYISGFNFISMDVDPDDPNYDTAVSNLVDDMVKLLGAGEYWGERMDRVARNLITVMNKVNELTGDDALDMTFVDLYYILMSEASRQEFVAMVKNAGMHFIDEYTEQIAEFDQDTLEPLQGRFQKWIQNDTARRMIGFREETISIPEAVEDGKIIIVRMGMQSKNLKRMLGMAVIRRIWTTIRSRANMSEYERDPFFLYCDEFDNLVLADETIVTMLSEARSYKLGLTLAMQYPGQVPEEVMEGILTNCKTVQAFNPGDDKQAGAFNTQLGLDTDTLTSESDYHFWMRRDQEGGMERSEAFRVYSFPPFPPLRSEEARNALIDDALQRHGREVPDKETEKKRLLYNHGNGRWETGYGEMVAMASGEEKEIEKRTLRNQAPRPEDFPLGSPSSGGEDSGAPASASTALSEDASEQATTSGGESDSASVLETHRETLLLSVYAVRVRRNLEAGAFVTADAVKAEFKQRVDDDVSTSLSELSNLLEQLAAGGNVAEWERRDGESHIRLTPAGKAEVFSQDTGSAGSGGGDDHRWVLRESFATFTRLGYHTILPEQEGEEQPDGLAEAPVDVTDVDESLSRNEMLEAIEGRRDQLRDEYPGVWNLAGADNVSIEAETSTFKYPFQTFRNLGKAMDRGDLCVFTTKDGSADHDDFGYYGRRLEQALYRTTGPLRGGSKTIDYDTLNVMKHRDDEGRERFYTEGNHLTVDDGKKALRPAQHDDYGSVSWFREPDTGDIVGAYSVNGTFPDEDYECARFDNPAAVADGDPTAVEARYEYDHSEGEYVVYTRSGEKKHYQSEDELTEHWETFNKPFIPENEFPEPPTEDDLLIVIMPDDDNSEYDEPQVYRHGELTPLFDHVDVDTSLPDTAGADAIPSDAPQEADSDAAPASDHFDSDEQVEAADSGSTDTVELDDPVESRLSPGALSAKTMLDEDLCEKILDGQYRPQEGHRDALRDALEELRPDSADASDLPPVFDEPWFNGEAAFGTGGSPKRQSDSSTSRSGRSDDESDAVDVEGDEVTGEVGGDEASGLAEDANEESASDDTAPAADASTTTSDDTSGTAVKMARAIAGPENTTPKHRESVDAIDPELTTEGEGEGETDDNPEPVSIPDTEVESAGEQSTTESDQPDQEGDSSDEDDLEEPDLNDEFFEKF